MQNTSLIIVTKFSYRDGAAGYLVSTVVLYAETLKLVLSCLLLVATDGTGALRGAMRDMRCNAVRLLVPSLMYVIQNNLLFHGVRLLSATLYMICSQSKILSSALWSALLLKTQISRKQYVSLVLLMVGMVLVQIDESRNKSAPLEAGQTIVKQNLQGTCAVFAAACTSGFAGAYLENMYKQTGEGHRSVWFRNAQLAAFSCPTAMLLAYLQDATAIAERGFMYGYDGVVLTVILLHAVGGLVVASVLRYAGNVLKCFAVSISICSCIVLAKFLPQEGLQQEMSTRVLVGTVLVIWSTFLYSNVI